MMKRLAILTAVVGAVIAVGVNTTPAEYRRYERVWAAVAAYPLPVVLLAGTLLLVVFGRGRSGRPPAPESPVLVRANARVTWTQLLSDQLALVSRLQTLAGTVAKAEDEAGRAARAVGEAELVLAACRKTLDEADARLDALCAEQAAAESELAGVRAELERLADQV